MIRNAFALTIAVVFASGSALAAPAATLSDVSGSVMVDSGKGFQKVATSAEVAPGSRVLVSKGGSAVLGYAAGCAKPLQANTITTVAGSEACQPATQVAGQETSKGLCTAAHQDENNKWWCTAWIAAGGAAVVGGLVGYAIGQSGGSDNIIYIPISN